MKKIMLVLALALSLVVCILAFTSCGGHEHTWLLESTVDREATCTEAGQRSVKCLDCGAINEDSIVEIPAAHKWATEFTVDTQATCTEKGQKSVRCTVCFESNPATVQEIPMTAHSYSSVSTVDKFATCTEEGQLSKKCISCQAPDPSSIVVLPASHVWHELATTDIEKTCTTDGQISIKCDVCGVKDESSITVVPASHSWAAEATVDTPKTCTTSGRKSVKCTACGVSDPGSVTTIPASHNATYVTLSVATMFTEGRKSGTCLDCGTVDEIVTAKTKADSKKFNGEGSTTVKKYNIREEIRGTEHFYPTEEHPNGQDFFYEFTFLWSPTLARSDWGYIEFGRFGNSGGGNGDVPFFLVLKDNAYEDGADLWCPFAGGFEISEGSFDANREGTTNGFYYGPHMPDGRPGTGNTVTEADYPILGDYGWHRIGIQLHQEAKVVDKAVKYELTATLYIDGVKVSSYAYQPRFEQNLLFRASLADDGELEYEDVDGGWFYIYRVGDSGTTGGDAYITVGDISMTVGDSFVLDVEPEDNPTPATISVGGETLDGTVHFRVK